MQQHGSMVANNLAQTPKPWGESKGPNTLFSEYGHVAYIILKGMTHAATW